MQWAARTTNVKLPSENQSTFETTDSEKKVLTLLLSIGFVTLLFATFFDKNVTSAVMDQNSILIKC